MSLKATLISWLPFLDVYCQEVSIWKNHSSFWDTARGYYFHYSLWVCFFFKIPCAVYPYSLFILYIALCTFWANLIAQLEKNLCAMQETRLDSRVGKIHWRRDRLPTLVFLGFPCGSAGRESACNVRDLGSIPGLGRSPGEGNKPSTPVFWPGEVYEL